MTWEEGDEEAAREGGCRRLKKMLGFSYDVFICVLLGLGFVEFQLESLMS